ncbi:hypothetical protein Tco_1560958 [Tanacetum coccineum]
MKVEESLNVTIDETPLPPKTLPLEDDDLVEEDTIKVSEIKPLSNDVEDESLESNEIINIKESKSHPLENVIAQGVRPSNRICIRLTVLLSLTGTFLSENTYDVNHIESRNHHRQELFDVDSGRISIRHYEY